MNDLLKNARKNKGFTTRKLAELTSIDQALISKYESCQRIPTKAQIEILAKTLEINLSTLTVAWYKSKLKNSIDFSPFAIEAITEILQEKGIQIQQENKDNKISEILFEIENLKNKLTNL